MIRNEMTQTKLFPKFYQFNLGIFFWSMLLCYVKQLNAMRLRYKPIVFSMENNYLCIDFQYTFLF